MPSDEGGQDKRLEPGATGVITVDLAALKANWRALAGLVAPAHCGAVVKANAYGLGAARVIPALGQAGCKTFFVATLEEARQARALAPDCVIYVLDGLLPAMGEALLATNCWPVLSSLAELRDWARLAGTTRSALPCALHIDSGLNRLGLSRAEVEALARDRTLLATLDIKLVMSHLASADDPGDPKNAQQLVNFNRLRALLPSILPASLAASDGLMLGPDYHFDLVRPGYALYGGQASKAFAAPVKPVVRVCARILQVRDVAAGETVGYSGTWRADRPRRIAVIACGYADGFARALSATNEAAGGVVSIRGQPAPIVGRVSMDLITADITHLEPLRIARGDMAELIGPGLPIEAMGARAGTIGYEVLTRLGPRFQRVYSDAGEET